jgi:hypothetical protein
MYRSVLASLTVVSLMLTVVPGSAQQRTPATGVTPQVQPTQVQQQDCPKVIAEVNTAISVRFDATAANARQAVAEATKRQADGKYFECYSTARAALTSLGAQEPVIKLGYGRGVLDDGTSCIWQSPPILNESGPRAYCYRTFAAES